MTRHVAYDEFALHLLKYISEAESDPLYIDDKGKVVLSTQQYEGLLETLRVLSNPDVAKEFHEAIATVASGLWK
jgi:PHD/YefM family antitoxin component YafN of YafNO toxin-antitoxin module